MTLHTPYTPALSSCEAVRVADGVVPPLSRQHLIERCHAVAARVERLQAKQDAEPTHRGLVRLMDARTALLAAENAVRRNHG